MKVTTHLKGGENRSEGCEWQLDQIREFIFRDLVGYLTDDEVAEEWQKLSSTYIKAYQYHEQDCLNHANSADDCHYLYACPDNVNLHKQPAANNGILLLDDGPSGLKDENLSFTQTGLQRVRF